MKLAAHDLTFIAEDLGRRDPPPLRYLAVLSRHTSEVVREGVVYGLSRCADRPEARATLEQMAIADPNEIVRNAALEALEP